MKTLVCEMCGSNNLLKEDGVFVCQNCKTKYTVEEAKRMMIDGTVDVSGTVKVDNTDAVSKYLQNARRAKAKEDWEETEKYYNLVEQNDPDNIEAIFYSSYGKAKRSLIEDDIYKRQQVFKTFNNCISLLDDKFDAKNAESEKESLEGIHKDMMILLASEFVYTLKKNLKGEVTENNSYMTHALFKSAAKAYVETLQNIIKKSPCLYLYDMLIDFIKYYRLLPYCVSYDNFEKVYDNVLEEVSKISDDPKYKKDVLSEDIRKLKSERDALKKAKSYGCSISSILIAPIIIGLCCIMSLIMYGEIHWSMQEVFPKVLLGGVAFTVIIILIKAIINKKSDYKGKISKIDAEIFKKEKEIENLK